MRVAPAAAVLLLLSLAVACGEAASGQPPSPTVATRAECAPARNSTAADRNETLTVDGISRTYVVHVPSGYDGATPAPLAVALPGDAYAGAQAFAETTGIEEAADERGYVLVVPDAPTGWDIDALPGGSADVSFIEQAIDATTTQLCIDDARIYAAGYADGGTMVQRLACEPSARFAAIGVVAGGYGNCQANVPMIAMHGTADPIVLFEGGMAPPERGGLPYPPVRRWVSEWAAAVGCDRLPTISRLSASVEVSTFARCLGGDGEVLLYAVIEGGRAWPGAAPMQEDDGEPPAPLNASEVILDFFTERAGGD